MAIGPIMKGGEPPPLGVLMVLANPVDRRRYDDTRIWWDATEATELFRARGLVTLARLGVPTEGALREQLAQDYWHVLHLIVHSRELRAARHGTIALQRSDQTARELSADFMAKLLARSPSLRLVVLQACDDESSDFATVVDAIVAHGITVVVAPPLDREAERSFISSLLTGALEGSSANGLFREISTALRGEMSRAGALRVAARNLRQPIFPARIEAAVEDREQGPAQADEIPSTPSTAPTTSPLPSSHPPKSPRRAATPTAASLRQLLDAVLRGASDFDAFCLDHFPKTYHRFTSGMDRVAKTNLVLLYEDHGDVFTKLHESHAAGIAKHRALLRYE